MPSKPCVVCGRVITWRKKWERSWPEVKFCSAKCRGQKSDVRHRQLEDATLTLLRQRSAGATVCPSEVARLAAPDDWQALMEPVRQAARRLVAQGLLEITQGGAVVNPSTARGPIRLRLARSTSVRLTDA